MTFNNRDSPSIPLYKELKILPLEKSYELKNAKHLWKLHNGYLPQSLASNLNVNSRNQITKSYSRLESLKRFSLFTAPSIWNKLPNSTKDKTTLKSFSDSVKLHLLNELLKAPYFWHVFFNICVKCASYSILFAAFLRSHALSKKD